jgi:hypothetical protein
VVEGNRRFVRERHALLGFGRARITYWIPAKSGLQDYRTRNDVIARNMRSRGLVGPNAEFFPATEENALSWLRRKLGDQSYAIIKTTDPQLVQPVRKWFPEALCILDAKP